MLDKYVKRILQSRVYDVAVETPIHAAPLISKRIGNRVLLKREDLQPVFSFKLRGAYNKLCQLSREQLDRGVICASAGNHAQGMAGGHLHGSESHHRDAADHTGHQGQLGAKPRW